MFKFNKAILFAVAGLGLVGAANAQTTCTTLALGTSNNLGVITPGTITTVGVEGMTEPVGSIALGTCSGTANNATVVFTSNVPLTNASNSANTPNLDIVASANITNNTLATISVLVGGVATNVAAAGSATVSASTVVETGNTLTMTFNLAGATLNSVTATGLRVKANDVPASSVITISASGVAGGGFTGAVAAISVANVLVSLSTSTLVSAANVSLCTVAATSLVPVTTLTVGENFNAGFKTIAQNGGGAILATQNSRIAVTFNNLNANVNYYVPGSLSTTVGVPTVALGLVTASLANAATTGGTLALTAYNAATGNTAATTAAVNVTSTTTLAGLVLLTVTNGSATIYYGTTATDLGVVENATITLMAQVPSRSAVNATSTSAPTAVVTLAGVATGYPQLAVQTPAATAAPAVTNTNGILTACSTTLLFPYVVNVSGYDTGIAISNTSTGVTGAAATTGGCTVTFYGNASTAVAYSTGNIASGSPASTVAGPTAAFLLSDKAPGLNGYAVAVCNFAQAHGYAFVTSAAGTPAATSASYLAVVTNINGVANTVAVQ